MNYDDVMKKVDEICEMISDMPVNEKVSVLNDIRAKLHEYSPFKDEPTDCVLWLKGDEIKPNNYNPNYVASPEMTLLTHSIQKYHYAMPIVAFNNDDRIIVVDGEHRHIIGTTNTEISNRLYGYLPISLLDENSTQGDLVAATIDFNRARGEHKVMSMGDIVKILLDNEWEDDKIAKELGMSVEELLRLKQIKGIAASLANKEYAKSWIMTP